MRSNFKIQLYSQWKTKVVDYNNDVLHILKLLNA